jgi:hypothetical protein
MANRSLFVFLSLAALAACSSPSVGPSLSSGALPATQTFVSREARLLPGSTPTLYVSYLESNSVTLYPANVPSPPPIRTITSGISSPEGIWVDAKGTLYVTNTDIGGGHFTITKYPANASQPSLTINATTYRPLSVAVDSKGHVYVGGNENGTVVINEYAPGGTKPIKTVFPTTLTGDPFMGGLAVDQRDNLYAAFFVYRHPPAHVVRFAPGLTNEKDLNLAGLNTIDLDAGLGIDSSGNLYVGGALNGINVYLQGSKNPARAINGGDSQYFAVTPSGALYDPEAGFVDEFAPGASSPSVQFADARYPVGAAVH